MQVAYFVNSGSEANDMAMMMARLYTGNYDMLALRNCYHGMSEGTMGVTAHSTWKFNVPQVRQSNSSHFPQGCFFSLPLLSCFVNTLLTPQLVVRV